MTTYFFHLRDGTDRVLDPQGRTVGDPADLKTIATAEARALMAQDVLNGTLMLGQRIEVEDEQGQIVCRLDFADAIRILDTDGGNGGPP